MDQNPSDSEILRFSDQLDPTEMYKLVILLGITDKEWKNMEYNHPHNIEMVKFLLLIKWRENKHGIFRDLDTALGEMELKAHLLCQVSTGSINKV